MKKNFTVVSLLFLLLILPTPIVSADDSLDIEAYAQDMQPGWNLGNSFDAVGQDETAWGNPPVTQALIDQIAAQGYNSIRIPVTFDQRMGHAPDYTINQDFLDRVTQAVDWSLDTGMKVMINVHHDSWIWLESGMANNQQQTVARFQAIWEQLADHFKDYPIELMFESINEPRFNADPSTSQQYLDRLNDEFHQIVRNSGGLNHMRPLVIPTLDTGAEPEKVNGLSNWINSKQDPNMMATIHYYGFWPFSVNIAGVTRFDHESINHMHDAFDRVHNRFTAQGIPVIVGEFGLLGFDTDLNTIQQGEKLKFFEYMIHYAKEKAFVHMLWDNGQHFGRTSFQWSDPDLYQVMKASWSGRSATAEADFIYFKQGEPLTDQTLNLNLNGRTLESIKINGQRLSASNDYALNGDQLTLKHQALSPFINLNQLGTRATLELHFDQGAAWKVNLTVYDRPTVQANSGDYRTFHIPTQFNGDQLATMEALYLHGEAAGPQNWTTYKEFGYVFSPDYDQNRVVFTYNEWDQHSRLFDEIRHNEPILIRLHFWSGEVIEYQVMRQGNTVTGSPVTN
ncbi:cellulase family glycosylhydrolase [Amphibacillus cookii]|uniref:cellulase family glycosylhydrolase n=1 Tax=Amphibacillus cookii TaxID=767787 RepID=UPI0019587A74|nr:cellulase family glycosylhydrolase [Amphibacillus cookii]MBM7539845.1 endoglucanase [Amphibacillus cookii]